MRHLSTLVLLLLGLGTCLAQNNNLTISGHVSDSANGEKLIGATVYVTELNTGAATNLYGFYSISLAPGDYVLQYSYIGYQDEEKIISLTENVKVDIDLTPDSAVTAEVLVLAERKDENVKSVEMSKQKLGIKKIKSIPAVFGEVDVIKAIQLLPGVSATGEGQSGFNVRGGSVDQNLILLDEAPVYNAAHFLGFFSVFNPDAVKNVEIYKGGIPAEYGGRLSSVLDIRMKDGNNKKFSATGGIGSISSRLTLEAPLKKDESSFIVSGRRTYADLFLAFAKDSTVRENSVYFYDLNAKVNYKLGENDRIYLSGYFGDDAFKSGTFGFSWGNRTGTARWNHVFNDKLFSNLTLIYSNYDYSLGDDDKSQNTGFKWISSIQDLSAKLDFNYFLNTNNTLKFGVQTAHHTFKPGVIKGVGTESIFGEFKLDDNLALESAAYLSNEHKITPRFTALYGVRYSHFNNLGGNNVYTYNQNYEVVDTTFYEKGKSYNSFGNLEPRLGLRYSITETSSVKASYNRMAQYVHLASNGISSSPLDLWFPSTTNVEPQIADQVAIGYFHNFIDDSYEGSLEFYYKDIKNAIDFKDHAQLLVNNFIEGELRFGEARAYGAELLIKKNTGRFAGWLGYTLSRTERKIAEINDGDWYVATWDKTHDLSAVASYEYSKRSTFSANWVYATGRAITLPTGRFDYNGSSVPVYSDRNAERMPAYHRLDLAWKLNCKEKVDRKLFWDLNVSVYNAYNRHNAYTINFAEADSEDLPEGQEPDVEATKTYIFPILPAVTWNFKF